MQELEKQHSQESKLLNASHTENQHHNDDEILMAQAIHQAQSLDEALKLQDQAQIQATLDNKQEHQSSNNYDAFEASYPAGSDGADVAWTFEQDEAAKIGVNAAAPIVVSTNSQALEAAKIAAVLAAEAGGDKTIQEAAAVAAAAAAAGNSNIDVNVYSQNNLTSDHATKAEINAVNDELDKSLSKLDLQEPKRSLLSLTWPIFIDLSLHFATLIINTIMVGMVSVKAVAELTIGNQVFDLALIIFNFFILVYA